MGNETIGMTTPTRPDGSAGEALPCPWDGERGRLSVYHANDEQSGSPTRGQKLPCADVTCLVCGASRTYIGKPDESLAHAESQAITAWNRRAPDQRTAEAGKAPHLTDRECDVFRRLPCPFNDMLRATYRAGWNAALSQPKAGVKP